MPTTIRNQKLFCLNCGGEFALKMPIPIPEMTKKMKSFDDLHKDCEPTWTEPITDQSQDVKEKAMWWFSNGEKGMSSETMWAYFMHNTTTQAHHPYDPDDFKRCYKLLEAVPEWKERILELSKLSPAWKNLSENWDKLTQMYEQNIREDWKNYKKIGMYEFMETLITR